MSDSLIPQEVEKYLPAPCDICCTEPGFCRDCSRILCAKTVSSDHGDYSFIKCLVNTGESICCHIAHLKCSIRAHIAGTVGGSIGLDAEYLCQNCDERTDLISHVNKLLRTCDAVNLDEEIQKKILNLGACRLRGSQKADAKELMNHIELGISKLVANDSQVKEISITFINLLLSLCKTYDQLDSLDQLMCLPNVEDAVKVDDNLNTHSVGLSDKGNAEMEVMVRESSLVVRTVEESYDHLPPSLKLDIEVDLILFDLRNSQELDYAIAEE